MTDNYYLKSASTVVGHCQMYEAQFIQRFRSWRYFRLQINWMTDNGLNRTASSIFRLSAMKYLANEENGEGVLLEIVFNE